MRRQIALKVLSVGVLSAALAGCDGDKVTIAVSPTGEIRTPAAALDALRAVKARIAKEGKSDLAIEVVFADGVYRVEKPLALTAGDSGTPSAPVVWRAANRGKAVFTAATSLPEGPARRCDVPRTREVSDAISRNALCVIIRPIDVDDHDCRDLSLACGRH